MRIPSASCILPWLIHSLSKGEEALYEYNIWDILLLKQSLFIWNSNVLFWVILLREDSQLSFILRKHTKTILIPYPSPTNHPARRCLSCLPLPWLLPRKTAWQQTHISCCPGWFCLNLAGSDLHRSLTLSGWSETVQGGYNNLHFWTLQFWTQSLSTILSKFPRGVIVSIH